MQSERIIFTATSYWASHLGCSTEAIFAQPLDVITHGADLADYDGIFALFRGCAATISVPPDYIESFRHQLLRQPLTPALFADVFRGSGFTVIGPAYIGYAEVVCPPVHPVRSLTGHDVSAAEVLKAACAEIEWEHGGSLVGKHPCSGVFIDSKLVALAAYEIWRCGIAHISIITHPAFRGRGFGRSAVAHVARAALTAGLVPQYRTLQSNRTSIRIAESLGFFHYATSVAVRLNRAA